MVSATELKIGSVVSKEGEMVIVVQLLEDEAEITAGEKSKKRRERCAYEVLEPVVVAPELIRQYGFVKHPFFPHLEAFHHPKYLFNLNFVANTCEVSFGLIAESVAIIYQKKLHFHQLQMLFFMLTGHELVQSPLT